VLYLDAMILNFCFWSPSPKSSVAKFARTLELLLSQGSIMDALETVVKHRNLVVERAVFNARDSVRKAKL